MQGITTQILFYNQVKLNNSTNQYSSKKTKTTRLAGKKSESVCSNLQSIGSKFQQQFLSM